MLKGGAVVNRGDGRQMPYQPIMLLDVELRGRPSPVAPETTPDGRPYERIQILIRDDGRPIGHVTVDLPEEGLSGDQLSAAAQGVVAGRTAPGTRHDHGGESGITVVIATRDRSQELLRCLTSLDRQTFSADDVIVVENTPSPTEVRDLIAGLTIAGRTPRYIHEPRPGLSLAHNAALDLIATPLVAFTDDDVEADPAWLAELTAAFRSQENVGCVTGLIYPASLDDETQYLVEGIGFGKAYDRHVFDLTRNRPMDSLFPFAIGRCGSGANMAYRTEILRAVGGFDPALGAGSPGRGGDDLAAFFDVITAGYAIVYEPAALVRHYHDPSPQRFSRQLRNYGTGLGAYLTRCLVVAPKKAPQFVLNIPGGLLHLARSNGAGGGGLPLRPRLAGLLTGPNAYRKGRRAARQHVG